ncbi:hypothetical protein D3C76_1123070 [compost metagenome]
MLKIGWFGSPYKASTEALYWPPMSSSRTSAAKASGRIWTTFPLGRGPRKASLSRTTDCSVSVSIPPGWASSASKFCRAQCSKDWVASLKALCASMMGSAAMLAWNAAALLALNR